MTETPETVSDVVARRVRELRQQRGWSAARLAERCAETGMPQLTASVIANIESGRRDKKSGRRRRDVTVDEAIAFASALDEPVATLLGGAGGTDPDMLDELRAQVWTLERTLTDMATARDSLHVQRSRIIGPGATTPRRGRYFEPPWSEPEQEGGNG